MYRHWGSVHVVRPICQLEYKINISNKIETCHLLYNNKRLPWKKKDDYTVNTQNVSATKIVVSPSIQRAETKYGLRIQFLPLVWLNA